MDDQEKSYDEPTEDLIWSEYPEELYLMRMLEENGNVNSGDSLMGNSTLEDLIAHAKVKGRVTRWTDFAPIARSVETSTNEDAGISLSRLAALGADTRQDSDIVTRNQDDEEPETPQARNVKPRVLELQFDDMVSLDPLADPSALLPDIVDIEASHRNEIHFPKDTGMSTLTGDTIINGRHQMDFEAVRMPEFCVDSPPRHIRTTSTKVLTPATQHSEDESPPVDTKEGGGFLNMFRRAAKFRTFRWTVNVSVVLLVAVIVLIVTYMLTRPNEDPISSQWASANRPPRPVASPTNSPIISPILPSPTTFPVSPSPGSRPPTGAEGATSAPITLEAIEGLSSTMEATLDLIAEYMPISRPAFADSTSPQFQALQWVAADLEARPLDQDRVLQRYALAVLFFSTNGHSWKHAGGWLNSDDECKWFTTAPDSMPCDGSGLMTHLDLQDNNLVGSIPSEIALLSKSVERIFLNNNSLWGPIPPSISELSKLERLYVTVNRLQGSIPSELGGLSRLEHLGLGRNSFTGVLPTGLSPSLKLLDLARNSLAGTIPSQIGNLTLLEQVMFGLNILTGTIPTEVGSLTRLRSLKLQSNRLRGAMPDEVCQRTLAELDVILVDCDEIQCDCCDC